MSGKTRKPMTAKQAAAAMKKHADEYKLYVKAQIVRKDATSARATNAAQKEMDSHRDGYTAFRNAYRALKAAGGTTPQKPKKTKTSTTKATPKKKTTTTTKKRGGSRRASSVKTTKLSKAAMARRTKDNPNGLTDAQLAKQNSNNSGDDFSPAVTPNAVVISSGK